MTKVTLRLRKVKNNKEMSYYYLDFYPPVFNPMTRKTRRHEYLNFSVYNNPQNKLQREHNDDIRMRAEAMRSRRELEIINMEYNIFDQKVLNESFIEFFEEEGRTKHTKWHAACQQFKKYVNGKCSFANVTVEVCEGFKNFLLSEAVNRRDGQPLNVNTASAYYCMLKCCIKDAFKAKKMKDNPLDYLDRIQEKPTKRPYLTKEEVLRLKEAPCKYDVLKNASMFAILKSQLIRDYKEHEADVLFQTVGNIFSGQVNGKTADDFDHQIDDKFFYGKILIDRKAQKERRKNWVDIPRITSFGEEEIREQIFSHPEEAMAEYYKLKILEGSIVYAPDELKAKSLEMARATVGKKREKLLEEITAKAQENAVQKRITANLQQIRQDVKNIIARETASSEPDPETQAIARQAEEDERKRQAIAEKNRKVDAVS